MKRCQLFLCVLLAAAVWSGPPAWAQPAAVDASNPLIYYRGDPTRFGGNAGWLPMFLRFAGATGVVPSDQQEVFEALTVAGLMGTYPHRFVLLDLKADRFRPRELRIKEAAGVLVFDAPGQHAQIRQTLASVLLMDDENDAAAVVQTAFELPPAPGADQPRPAVRFTREGWAAHQVIEWTADGQRFTIGFGEGALAGWVAWQDEQDERRDQPIDQIEPATRIEQHQNEVARARGGAAGDDLFFELYLDLKGIKRAAPTLFHTGRISPFLRLYHLEEADDWMMHGRWSQTFLLFDVTWENNKQNKRQDPGHQDPADQAGDGMKHLALSQDHWPKSAVDAGVPKPPGHFHVAAPINWPAAVNQVMQLIWLAHEPEDRHLVTGNLSAFFEQTNVTFSKSLSRFEPYLLLSGYPRAVLPIPGTATLYAPLKKEADPAVARQEFDRMMRVLLPGHDSPLAIANPMDADALRVRQDAATGVYWLDSPLRAIFKAPAWVWHEPGAAETSEGGKHAVLVGSYSPQAVLTNTRWLDQQTVNAQGDDAQAE